MNKKSIIIDSILAVAIVVLFVLVLCPCKKHECCKTSECAAAPGEGAALSIALIDNDSLMEHYLFAQEAKDRLMTKQEDASVKLNDKAKAFEKEYATFTKEAADFQRKVEAGAFLTRERAESEQNRLQKKQEQLLKQQQDLETLQANLQNDYMAELQALNQQLNDTIEAYLEEYNKEGRYQLIINSIAVLNAIEGYDITDEVVEALNARYKK